ncbi:MAG: twin-arginine translocation pathway signal [Paracoccus sp.]|nr:twin-arginine translocation pathway signal [Paracoccus sp. (in: a-proteobacteria)]
MPSRRLFLKSAAVIGCSAAAHPWMSSMTFASTPGENRLVVIILRGAMDGLDAFQPYGDANLRGLRSSISIGPEQGAHDLDGYFALHPSLGTLLPLWKAGELAFAPAVSTPYRDKRSHFDGQDILEAGTGTDLAPGDQRDGWLNRLLQNMPGAQSRTAYSIGTEEMRILSGSAPAKSWAPQVRLRISPQAELLLRRIYEDDPLFHAAAEEAIEIAAEDLTPAQGTGRPQRDASGIASFAAARLNEETRIATFSLPGWDSHASQARTLGRAFERLAAVILTLKTDLGRNWARTTVLAMTEFGRTARENGSGGTDHGTGGTMLMAGGAIRGGRMIGAWPGLAEGDLYAGRDLMPMRDIRAYAAWAMRDLFAIPRDTLERVVFPDLDMEENPRILA